MEKDKLKELLDKYIELVWEQDVREIPTTKIISKSRWFVKRLVEQDKIDLNKVEEKSEYTFLKKRWWEHFCEDVIMLLSISEQPIDLLISLLKDGK
jgi:hypothetical protein